MSYTPDIRVHVDQDPQDPKRLDVWISGLAEEGVELPLAVQDDLRLAKARFFTGGCHLNVASTRDGLGRRLQDIIERHKVLGNLEYEAGAGFLKMRTSTWVLDH